MLHRSSSQALVFAFVLAGLTFGAPGASAQGARNPSLSSLSTASQLVLPQRRAWSLRVGEQPVVVEEVVAHVKILEQSATTTLEVRLHNPGARQAEAVLLLPTPPQAAVSGFAFDGAAAEPTARLLPRDEARETYRSIVQRLRDPALLEFAGFNLIQTSVFPVPAGGKQRVRLTYEQVLPADGQRVDYVLPRSEQLDVGCPWRIAVELSSKRPISMVYSPTHDLETERHSGGRVTVQVAEKSRRDPGAFRLSYLLEGQGVSASLFAYPDPSVLPEGATGGAGYFLLVAGLPATPPPSELKREVTLVLDRSGSMAGEKMDQVRAVALQILEGLEDGEAFNIIDYATSVERFAKAPVVKSRETILQARDYLAGLRTNGGTNIHAALVEALRQDSTAGAVPLVLFLTDGLPTVGRTAETTIAEVIEKGNPHERRVFTFGVGADVNAPLLDRLADHSRAVATYVLPGEDVELKVASVYRKLHGPILASPELAVLTPEGEVTTRRARELIPSRIPDLFEGDQLVLLGQYVGDEPLHVRLGGNYLGKTRTFHFEFDLGKATTRNAFVPRLWASRRIAHLVDEIRQAGAAVGTQPMVAGSNVMADPRLRELSNEILRLSTEFGILSEYTSFLATEGTDLGAWNTLKLVCDNNLEELAIRQRSGASAVAQATNFNDKKLQSKLNYQNGLLDAKLERVSFSTVQQVADRAFFNQSGRWVDCRLVGRDEALTPDETIRFGSAEHLAILEQLVAEGRQSTLALSGEILLQHEGRKILVVGGGE